MTDWIKITSTRTVYQTGRIVLHGPIRNFFGFKLTPSFIKRHPNNNGREVVKGIHNCFPFRPKSLLTLESDPSLIFVQKSAPVAYPKHCLPSHHSAYLAKLIFQAGRNGNT